MPSNLFKAYQGEQVGQINILPSVAKINEMLLMGADTLGKGIGDAIKAYSDKVDNENLRKADAGMETTNPVTEVSNYYIGAPDPSKGIYDQIKSGYDKYSDNIKQANEAASKNGGKVTDLITEEAFYKGALGMFKNYTSNAKNINQDLLAKWNEGIDATGRVLDAQFSGEQGAQIDNADYERATASNLDLALNDIKAKTPPQTTNERTTKAVNLLDKIDKNASIAELELLKLKRQHLVNGASADELTGNLKNESSWLGNFLTAGHTGTEEIKKRTAELSRGWTPESGIVSQYGIIGTAGSKSLGDIASQDWNKVSPELRDKLIEAKQNAQKNVGAIASEAALALKTSGDAGYDLALGKFDKAIKAKQDQISKATAEETENAKSKNLPTEQKVDEAKLLTQNWNKEYNPESLAFTDAVSSFTLQEKTWQQKRVSMQKYMVEHFGGVPSNFDDYFYQQHPEAALQVVNMGGNRVMINRKTGALTELQQIKGMDSEEMGKYRARQFGASDVNGGTDITKWGEYVPNSGLEVKGEALGTSEKVGDLREKLSQGAGAMQNIDKMLNMMDVDGRSMSPEMIGKSKAIQVALLANLRALFEKGVRISQWSNNVLKDASGNPTDFVSLDALTKPRLEELKDVLVQEMQNTGSSHGVAVRYKPTISKDTQLTQSTVDVLEKRKGK